MKEALSTYCEIHLHKAVRQTNLIYDGGKNEIQTDIQNEFVVDLLTQTFFKMFPNENVLVLC